MFIMICSPIQKINGFLNEFTQTHLMRFFINAREGAIMSEVTKYVIRLDSLTPKTT